MKTYTLKMTEEQLKRFHALLDAAVKGVGLPSAAAALELTQLVTEDEPVPAEPVAP